MGGDRDGFASYDLHLHTYWSYDATADPEAHFRRARELGVGTITITDHHVLDALRRECRLDGVECAHPSVPEEFTRLYREYCEENGLFSTGGSDCHSAEDIETKFGAHGGPDEWLDELLDRLDSR